ncbi:uncharacterized protein MAM_06171 [Metarhizium album ARSEF 1941]|uniref:Uncharacterized protein n=1 Tax=Metarhizium album (strain ARSEF 1941) TaxID=1081103 RepID=A0A0B2WJ43_METAS|nr:uncharacterized protein MAM_06171 [Metarhizium album ARSEF 1941]KHN96066.1 hypothetical protein MAM_06171 [Metarhizium album ARSEF 1941]
MRLSPILLLLTAAAAASAAPTRPQRPVIADDDTLLDRRAVVHVEIVQAHTSRFTNAVMTKITRYASDAASDVQGFLSGSFGGAVADPSGDVMTVAYGQRASPLTTAARRPHAHQDGRRRRHRISLLGFRNRLAVFILAFSLALAVVCSYLRRAYIVSLKEPVEAQAEVDTGSVEKASSRSNRADETTHSS